jgi:glycerol kinase
MESDSGLVPAALKVDGGATVNDFLMQLQADVAGIPVVRPEVRETTALGAALAAGMAAGIYASTDDIAGLWREDRVFQPEWTEDRRESAYAEWKRAVEKSRDWVR